MDPEFKNIIAHIHLNDCLHEINNLQKQPFRGVHRKRCSENMQQIYRRTPMPKCDSNKVGLKFYRNHTSAWMLVNKDLKSQKNQESYSENAFFFRIMLEFL